MAGRWPSAEVVGLDVSPELLRVAETLFGSPQLRFVEGPLVPGLVPGPFDLLVLLDVYEHIAPDDRLGLGLHSALAELMGDEARVVLSAPTPRHLQWLRENHPDEIQPIDEDITVEVLLDLASDTGTELCSYEEVGVWHDGDYLHAALRRPAGWAPVVTVGPKRGRFARWSSRLRRMLPSPSDGPSRSERAALVREKLGDVFTR